MLYIYIDPVLVNDLQTPPHPQKDRFGKIFLSYVSDDFKTKKNLKEHFFLNARNLKKNRKYLVFVNHILSGFQSNRATIASRIYKEKNISEQNKIKKAVQRYKTIYI